MKKLLLLTITLVLFFIESIFMTRLQIGGVTIPLSLIFGLAVSVVSDEWDAIFMGLVIGFLNDIYSLRFFGMNMLITVWVFFIASRLSFRLRREKNILMVLLMTVLGAVRYVLYSGVMKIAGVQVKIDRIPILTLSILVVGFIMLIFLRMLFNSSFMRSLTYR